MRQPADFDEFHIGDVSPIYVQRWGPAEPDAGRTAILIHGGAHCGMFWTTTPDGRPGWSRHLIDRGWTAFVADWPGVGRSPRGDDFLASGPMPSVEALAALLRAVGPALLVGHSIGAALAIKVMDLEPGLVTHFIAMNPAPPSILDVDRPPAPTDRPVRFDDEAVRALFANAGRFPQAALSAYRRSLYDLSPSILNAVSSTKDAQALAIRDKSRIQAIASIVVAGEADRLAPLPISEAVANLLACEHILVGRDWGFDGFGHMIPIEQGSEEILFRALACLGAGPT